MVWVGTPRAPPETAILSDKNQAAWLGLDDVIAQIHQRQEICERHIYEIELAKCDTLTALFAVEAYEASVPANARTTYGLNKAIQGFYKEQRDERLSLWQDVSKLKLKGQGHAQDSFSLVVQAAARHLGRRADYDTIYALSTNAFALGIRPDESCTAWWTMYGRDRCIQLVAGRLGLKARKVPLPDAGIKPGDAEAVWKAKLAKQRKASLLRLRQAIGRGDVVFTGGSWRTRLADGSFNPWCW